MRFRFFEAHVKHMFDVRFEEPETHIRPFFIIYEKLTGNGFKKSIFTYLSALILLTKYPDEHDHEDKINRALSIYKGMKLSVSFLGLRRFCIYEAKENKFHGFGIIPGFCLIIWKRIRRKPRKETDKMASAKLQQRLDQYKAIYSELKSDLKWKVTDQRTLMMIASMYVVKICVSGSSKRTSNIAAKV